MKSATKVEEEGPIGVKARSVLWYLAFSGFAINYILRTNASIAIVDMIDMRHQKISMNETEKILNSTSMADLGSLVNISRSDDATKFLSLERRLLDYLEIDYERDGFAWDEHQQSMVLGSFYWLHWTSQLPGGILAAKYGTKFIFCASNGIACVLCMLMPIMSYLSFKGMIILRVVQGLIAGFCWPSMNYLTGRWIPPNERGKFISSYLGSSVGVAISYPLFGFIIKSTSWEQVFHVCGIAGIIWSAAWLYFVYDSPELHPRIHPKERDFIIQSLGSSVMRKKDQNRDIPWKAILTSRPVWINSIAQWGGIWGLFTLLTQAPTYFRLIHGWGIEMTGILSGIPHLVRVAFAIGFSSFADHLLKSGKLSRNNVRKLATFITMVLNGFAVLAMAYCGNHPTLAVVLLIISVTFHGAVSSGALASVVDISPNYASITGGIVSTVAVVTGFVSPLVVGFFTFENQTPTAWQHIFEICAAMLIVCGLIYVFFNDASIQEWNQPKKNEDEEKEKTPLATLTN